MTVIGLVFCKTSWNCNLSSLKYQQNEGKVPEKSQFIAQADEEIFFVLQIFENLVTMSRLRVRPSDRVAVVEKSGFRNVRIGFGGKLFGRSENPESPETETSRRPSS